MNTPQEIYEGFLKEWPISRLRQMRIDEYTNLDKTSFCYWLEAITEPLGSIWGGSAYKFGIYKRRNTDKEINRNGYKTDTTYSWLLKYGNDSDEAFEKVKSIIITIAQAASQGSFSDIDKANLGFAYKWKIAFLYSGVQLINVFNENAVRKIANHFKIDNPWKPPVSTLQRIIKKQQQSGEDTWQFGGRLWQIFQETSEAKPIDRTFYKYSPGSAASRWEEDQQLGIMAINFLKLNSGSLSQYATHEELAVAIDADPKNSNNSLNLWYFKEAKIGDIVIANNGVNIVLGFGVITGPYEYFDDEQDFKHRRTVNWIANKEFKYIPSTIPKYTTLFRPDTFFTTKISKEIVTLYLQVHPEYIAEFKKYGMEPTQIITNPLPDAPDEIIHPLNQILFGPPGTGKTYSTAEIAFEIVNRKKAVNYAQSRDFFKNELQKDELTRRVDFITFHQNYSYEDFLIGIRPNINNNQTLSFNRHEGVFYKICQRAKENWLKSQTTEEYIPSFEDAFDSYFHDLYENNTPVTIKMKDQNYQYTLNLKDENTFIITNNVGVTRDTMSISTLKELFNGTRTIKGGMNAYYNPLIEELRAKAKEMSTAVAREARENFVLIIDEINRANISRVFGELITLIEEDKRMGRLHHLRMQLPNGEFFEVPENLYIVGTMNTADKSISLIDIALRRRFEFIGKYPDYDVLEDTYGPYIPLLKQINSRIYKKKNSADYLIGHAYFMSENGLIEIITKKVIPLLMEYFSGRIKDVLEILDGLVEVTYDEDIYKWIVKEK